MDSATAEVKEATAQKPHEPEIVDVADINSKAVGCYWVAWRHETKQVARLLGFADGEIQYELVTGPDKGKRYQAKYFGKTVKVYNEENLILAAVD